jgi:maltose phosphorylase
MVFRIYVWTNSESISGISVDHKELRKSKITDAELQSWKSIGCYVLSFSEEHNVYLQQDGFLDKELVRVADLDTNQRPINQKWSWDRILRSHIKQADVLQCFYFLKIIFREKN